MRVRKGYILKNVIIIPLLLLSFSFGFAGEFFDDFFYTDTEDSSLREHNWTIVDGIDAPPANTKYKAKNIRFEEDPTESDNRIMYLSASCKDSKESLRLSRIQSKHDFFEGTYATRIFFDNTLAKTQDGNIQAFYTISPIMEVNNDSYSECDFEYLSYDIWNKNGKTKPAYYLSTWEKYCSEPLLEDYAKTIVKKKLKGWHLVVIQIQNNEVNYFLDKNNKPIATHKTSELGSQVYPESNMCIAFANWITVNSDKKSKKRTSTMKVDWIYHIENEAVSLNEVYRRVRLLQKDEIKYLSTLGE